MILVDTNVLVTAGNTAQTNHRQRRELLETVQGDLLVVPMVVAEVCHLVGTRDRGGPAGEAACPPTIAAGSLQITTMLVASTPALINQQALALHKQRRRAPKGQGQR